MSLDNGGEVVDTIAKGLAVQYHLVMHGRGFRDRIEHGKF